MVSALEAPLAPLPLPNVEIPIDVSDGLPNLTIPIETNLSLPAITYPNKIMSIEVPAITAPNEVPAITYSNNISALTYFKLDDRDTIEKFEDGNNLLAIKSSPIEIDLQPHPPMETDVTPQLPSLPVL